MEPVSIDPWRRVGQDMSSSLDINTPATRGSAMPGANELQRRPA